jgi:protein-tyrosine phosphatase
MVRDVVAPRGVHRQALVLLSPGGSTLGRSLPAGSAPDLQIHVLFDCLHNVMRVMVNGASPLGVLFVCMGNICRSPTAEGVFRLAAARAGLLDRLRIDSAGTHGYHAGEPPDHRAVAAARARGYDIAAQRARQVEPEDFARFHWILAMDQANLRVLTEMRPRGYPGHLGLYLDLAPELGTREMPDPYYGGADGFHRVLDLSEAAGNALVARLHRVLAHQA